MKTINTLIILFLLLLNANAQPNFPGNNYIFTTDVLPRVDITISQDSLDWIYDNVDSDHEFKALFVFTIQEQVDTVEDIGFRLRGNTSRNSDKKSFKVSFNTFDKGRTFYGLEKMNLNGEHNDPSIIRSFLSWKLCRDIELVGSRSNHVDLYINNNYHGLYINVEHIDDAFVESRFNHDKGNLYKCLHPANLEYLGEDKNEYKSNGYTLKTNVERDDYSDLILFTRTLEETNAQDFPEDMEPIFNVNGFLRYLALETFIGHWDAYSYGKNNFYLYNNQYTGKMEFIPYDVDNTYGIDWYGIDWANRNIYSWWNQSEPRPLTEKVMENEVYRNRYSYFLNQLITNYANPTSFFTFIDNVKEKINQSAEEDVFRTMDYGWSYDDYNRSYTEAIGNHVTYGLKPYVTERIESIEEQLELNPINPIIENVYHNFPGLNEFIEIKIELTDDEPNPTATLFWGYAGSDFSSTEFEAIDGGSFIAWLTGFESDGTFEYYIEAADANGNVTREPAIGNYSFFMGNSDATLRINEFMASNTDLIHDNYGQSEDWIEIYNYGTEPVFLGDKYLTDDFNNRDKWKLPSITLDANAFYLVWADNDPDQGENHANFKLSKSGERIGMYDSFLQNFALIDTLTFGEQASNVSEGISESNVLEPQSFITPKGANGDTEVAYLTYRYNLQVEINNGNFSSQNDFLDIPATYNDWELTTKIVDNNEDGELMATFFGFSSGESIEYKARINGSWSNTELAGEDNRSFTLGGGANEVAHWYNDVVLSNKNSIIKTQVYPNPVSSGNLQIECSDLIKQFSIVNVQGKVVKQMQNVGTNAILQTSQFYSGIYFVHLTFENGNAEVHKIMVY